MTGYLITFEGIDLSGKSVQANLLYQRLVDSGYDTIFFRDPGTTRISERIREILLDSRHLEMSPWTELLLYEAARAQMVEEYIKPALAKGSIVVGDRLFDSTTAYQGYGRQLDLQLVSQANIIGACGVCPNLTFLIDIDPQIALSRQNQRKGKTDRLEDEDQNFHNRVRKGYLEIAKKEVNRFIVIDGTHSIARIQQKIWDIVIQKIN